MKKINIALVALTLFSGVTAVEAQDQNNPWKVGFGTNSVDIRNEPDFSGIFKDFGSFKDNNILPAISKLSVGRYIGAGFSVELEGTLNKIEKGYKWREGAKIWEEGQMLDENFWSANLQAKYALKNIFTPNHYWFDPFLKAGVGYGAIGEESDFKVLFGGGANFWFTKNVGIDIQSGYHHCFDATATDYIQHSAGLVVKFGAKDSDGDGISDKDDLCPTEPGKKEFGGCPDSDGDGIADKDDQCPNEAGSKEMNGCPDSDNDGIADSMDECPNEAGPAENKGCPYRDADGDGVLDKDDECVNEAGPRENKGCPYRDSDGDGVLDKDDQCPNKIGPASNKGCPEVSAKVQKQLNDFAKKILFDNGKATIKPASYGMLDDIVRTLNEFPNTRFTVEGHTDTTGKKAFNQKLSQERADSVKNYLVEKGISESRLTAIGYGPDKPKASNKTKKGRAENRRVEINLVK